MNPREIATISVLTALSIGSNYAMISLYNVKFMDLIVFVGGFCYGPLVGSLIGVLSWAIYGSLNPYGFSLLIWVATMSTEIIYAVFGWIARRAVNHQGLGGFKAKDFRMYFFFGMLGMFLTFAYDVITNVVFGFERGWGVLYSVVIGVPFSLVHVVSNGFFFSVGCVPAIKAVFKLEGGDSSGISEE